MKKLSVILLSALLFCSCGEAGSEGTKEKANDPETVTGAVTTTVSMSVSQPVTSATEKPELVKIESEIISYEDGKLTFEYEGETRSCDMSETAFAFSTDGEPEIRMINNRYGERIIGVLTFNSEQNRIVACDVIGRNAELFTQEDLVPKGQSYNVGDADMTVHRVEGSRALFQSKYGSFEADLNDLDNRYKIPMESDLEECAVTGYRFKESGRIMLETIESRDDVEEKNGEIVSISYSPKDNLSLYHFFGTVQSVKDGRASVLLTDGKTTCDVPTYYNDGEVKEGAEVMVVLDADTSLFGSGEQYKSDYAVFYTDPVSLLPKEKKDISLFAYAKCSQTQYGKFDCTEIAELEASSVDKKQQ